MTAARNTSWSYAGASVRGPGHAGLQLPNQDAWLVRINGKEMCAVVSDGLGSKPFSDFGAQMACKAAAHAVAVWRRNREAPHQSLLRILHSVWSAWIAPRKESDCAATCLFVHSDGERTVLAQLGDGMVAYGSPEKGFEVFPIPERDFSSETTGLGVCLDLKEWRIASTEHVECDFSILLASDGVSEDLLPDRLNEFIGFCSDRYLGESSRRRAGLLAQDLRNWPTPGHADDKTLVLLKWVGDKSSGGDRETT